MQDPALYYNQNHSFEWCFSTTWREKQKIKNQKTKKTQQQQQKISSPAAQLLRR